MDAEQTRIQADLRGLIEGDVHCDSLFTQMYANDASIYEVLPLGVARPRSTRDVSELMRYCHQHHIAVFPRGGGSGLAGQSLGRGLILDFSRYMRRIQLPRESTVRVQCGVVQADLNRVIDYHHLLFGPDPATRSVSSIGSMLSVDAAGSHFPLYGSAGDCVESLQLVLATGEVVELSRHPWAGESPNPSTEERLAQQVGVLLQQNSGLLLRPPWGDVARGCGYRVENVLDGDQVNMARLICGSEGTLGVITEATLRVSEIPATRGLILLFFSRLESAAKAALDIGREDVAACDLMDRRLLEIARETEPVYASIIPRGAEAMLLVELQGEEPASVRSRLLQILHRLQRRGKPVVSYRLTTDNAERNMLWRLARRFIPRLYRLKGNLRPLPFVEDMSIPPRRLPEFLREVQDILKAERVTATLFAHALHGQVDVRPFLDLANAGHQLRLTSLSEKLLEKVLEYGGVVGSRNTFGLSRAAWAERQLGPRLELCRKIKSIFDPEGILSPGKFLSPGPPRVNENLRRVPKFADKSLSSKSGRETLPVAGTTTKQLTSADTEPAEEVFGPINAEEIARADDAHPGLEGLHPVETLSHSLDAMREARDASHAKVANADGLDIAGRRNGSAKGGKLPVLLQWHEEETLGYAVRSCNGCGRCRTSAAAERMCPMFRVHKGEEASPRAKANLLRGVLTGSLELEQLESRELKAIADLCFNCHQCRLECPASVNVPKLVQEIKAQHVAGHGLPLSERLLNRVDLLAAMGSRFPRLANWALGNPTARWILERTFGIAGGRKLPRVTRRTFLRWAAREKLNRIERSAGRKVMFFVDQYVNWHNPLLGRALVEVFRHQKIDVYVPTAQTPSYMAMIAAGDAGRARKLIQTNIRTLAEAVRQGFDIVTTEPSAALCLREEYRNLVRDEDTELIAQHTFEACSYLWGLHRQNELELDFRTLSMSVMYHEPCHTRTLDASQPALNLMRLIPGLQVQTADAGCSGMAGTFGLQRKNFRTSVRIGWPLISTMKMTSAQFGTTECTSCKLQMEQGTTKPTVHPLALLAYAYGRMPQFAGWFSARNEGTVVS